VPEELTQAEARQLTAEAERIISGIQLRSLSDLRDRAIVGLIGYADVSLPALLGMRVYDYYEIGDRQLLRIIDGGEERNILLKRRSKVQKYVEEYIEAARLTDQQPFPLFRSTFEHGTKLAAEAISPKRAVAAIRARISATTKHFPMQKPYEDTINIGYLLDNVKPSNIANIRLRAILGLMLHASLSPSEIAAMRVSDYYNHRGVPFLRVGNHDPIVAKPPLPELLREYLVAIGRSRHRDGLLFGITLTRPIAPSRIHAIIAAAQASLGAHTNPERPVHAP
jgi:site-specific recombinase XerC